MNKKHQAINRVRQWVASFFARQSQRRTFVLVSILFFCFAVAVLSSAGSKNISPAAPAIPPIALEQSHNNAKPTEDADLSGKSPEELAAYVFEHHHCNNCHTMGAAGKLGFNERGKEVGKGFEGCISLLTSMHMACTDVERIIAK